MIILEVSVWKKWSSLICFTSPCFIQGQNSFSLNILLIDRTSLATNFSLKLLNMRTTSYCFCELGWSLFRIQSGWRFREKCLPKGRHISLLRDDMNQNNSTKFSTGNLIRFGHLYQTEKNLYFLSTIPILEQGI